MLKDSEVNEDEKKIGGSGKFKIVLTAIGLIMTLLAPVTIIKAVGTYSTVGKNKVEISNLEKELKENKDKILKLDAKKYKLYMQTKDADSLSINENLKSILKANGVNR